jgi:hypothetical protein
VKNNYAFSNVVAKFYKIFTGLSCKRHEAEKGGITFSRYKVNQEYTTAKELTFVRAMQLRIVSHWQHLR